MELAQETYLLHEEYTDKYLTSVAEIESDDYQKLFQYYQKCFLKHTFENRQCRIFHCTELQVVSLSKKGFSIASRVKHHEFLLA